MNKIENDPGYVEFTISSLVKKNYGALLHLEKKSTAMFGRGGLLYDDVSQDS
jgi:hypothetical protein